MYKRRAAGALALGLATAITVVGCSSSDSPNSNPSGDGNTANGEPVTITFWSWPEGTDKTVEEFNATHDDVQVKYTNAGGGDESAAKLLTAVRSGEAPDVSLVEYTTLPSLIVGGAVMDITDKVGDIQDAFSPGAWEQTTFDGVVYGVPQDVGPAAMVYNAKAFADAGITEPPATWDDFRKDAELIKAHDPKAVIGAYPPSELGFFASAAALTGSKWWSY